MNTITIIGTVHFMSQTITPDTIYDKLCELKPEIILNEIPIDCDNAIVKWMKDSLEFMPVNESIAVLRYLESHDVVLRAYDIRGLHAYVERTNNNKKEDDFEAAFGKYFKTPSPNQLALHYKKLIDRFKHLYGRWDKMTLEEMNSHACDIATEVYLKVNSITLPAILDLVPELTPLKSDWLRRERYEVRRDKAMVDNILDYIQQYENKNMVILCGYFHRYALIKGLTRSQSKHRFRLITELSS